MKFEEQVASYHSKLRRRSRFFSSLMLVSGISLAAAAPFLSYEVSQIECAEKGSVVTQDNSEEVQTLKRELEGMDEVITGLESKLAGQKEALSNLANNPDCENLVRVIENERDRLENELTELTDQSTLKDETITELERDLADRDEALSNLASNPDCDDIVQVIKTERDRLDEELTEVTTVSVAKDKYIVELKKMIETCENKLNQVSNSEPDCDKFSEEINRLNQVIILRDKTIEELNSTPPETVPCPTVKFSGTFHNNESFTVHQISFRVTINSDDANARYQLFRNKKNVTSRIRTTNQVAVYSFKANKIDYQLTFGDLQSGSLPYSLISL